MDINLILFFLFCIMAVFMFLGIIALIIRIFSFLKKFFTQTKKVISNSTTMNSYIRPNYKVDIDYDQYGNIQATNINNFKIPVEIIYDVKKLTKQTSNYVKANYSDDYDKANAIVDMFEVLSDIVINLRRANLRPTGRLFEQLFQVGDFMIKVLPSDYNSTKVYIEDLVYGEDGLLVTASED